MSRFGLFLLLLLCLSMPLAGWASALDGQLSAQSTAQSESTTGIADRDGSDRSVMVASADQPNADGDEDGCNDGRCTHCACGCDMGMCASACLALLAHPWAYFWNGANEAIPAAIVQQAAVVSDNTPLRPPIA